MRVYVENHTNDSEKLFEGTEAEVERQILFQYPWLRTNDLADRGDLEGTLEHLDSCQMYSVHVEHDGLSKSLDDGNGGAPIEAGDQLGYQPHLTAAFQAARFLSGKAEPSAPIRSMLWEADGDIRAAALRAFGLDVTDENLAALAAVEGMGQFSKDEPPGLTPPAPQSIVAAHPDGEDVAEEVRRAFKDHFVFEVMLSGKHSDGTLLARNQETGHSWLLKPGSGGQSTAAGAEEDPSSQSQREAAWYQVVKLWGLWDSFPRAELLLIDDEQVAALQFLGTAYNTLGKLEDTDPNLGRKAFLPYLQDGRLHEWAVLYFVLAETDGHSQNVMLNADNEVQFIDHGASFAGPDFDPAHDKNSFVPCFLRAWAPKVFNGLSVEQKLEYMPKVNQRIRAELKAWLDSLHADELEHILYRYGINPSACLERLAKVKTLATEMPVDLAINRLWVTV